MKNAELKDLILQEIKKQKEVKASDLVKSLGFTRAYLNRFLQELRQEGRIILLGRTNRSVYVLADKDAVASAKGRILSFSKTYKNESLSEHAVLEEIKRDTGIFNGIKDNVKKILDYAFSEMLNNAIDHSRSENIEIKFVSREELIFFSVKDFGVGIFNNIMKNKGLVSEIEAVQDLLKGKQTTAPERHSGEGIFFTSKVGDSLVIASGRKRIIFNNLVDDIFISDITSSEKGTRVFFAISKNSDLEIKTVFDEYSGDSYEFDKTRVAVRLYKIGSYYISRTQASRVMAGLEKFKRVVLDFKHINSIGQAFADEIFRVWISINPGIEISIENSNENIDLMISRAGFNTSH